MKRHFVSILVLATALTAAAAAAAEIAPNVPSCLPAGGNGVVSATLTPETGWSNVRVYFRAEGTDAYYFLEMRTDGAGHFWAALPEPAAPTRAVDVYLLAIPADGAEVRASEATVPVISSCAPSLTPDQRSYAQNLVVGETVPGQKGKPVVGFTCEGIVSRIASNGELRSDEACRKMLLAKAADNAAASGKGGSKWLLPVAVVGTVGVGAVLNDEEPPNPSPITPQ